MPPATAINKHQHPLDTFFSPDSIALIGASRDLEKIPGRLLSMLRKNEFPGRLYPVNPNYGVIDGLKCYPSIAAVGQPIDLAVVIIPARAVLGALTECAAVGVRNAVIISSGFAEEGGDSAAMQEAIAELAKKTGMRISGPNAEGFYSEAQRVAATFSPTVDVKPGTPRLIATRRRIGIVAQSGGIGFAIYHRARALGIALSYVISTGNESDLGAGEFFEYMVQDSSTDVILLFIEGIRDVDKFLAAARRAAEIGKPVIVTNVGGAGIWGADAVSMQGLQVPELSAPIQTEISKLLPSYGSARNPIDVTAQGVHSGGLQKSIDLLDVSDEVDAILVVLSLSSETRMPFRQAELKPVISAQHKPIVFYSYTLPSDFARNELAASGVVVLSGLTHVGVAMRRMVDDSKFKLARPVNSDALPSRDLSAHLKSPTMSEFDSKSLLRDAGIWLPEEVLVTERDALDAAIARVGLPLVMKIQSPDIPHKSEVGGVRVNIATKGEAFLAYGALLQSARRHRPEADIQGVLVGPMAKKGVEIIIGTMQDATFGPMVMAGFGGVTTELFRDVVYRPAPVSAPEAASMLAELKAAPLLSGFRGAARADVPLLCYLIEKVSLLAARSRNDIAEIELNPVLVHPEGQGVTIVDALVVRKN